MILWKKHCKIHKVEKSIEDLIDTEILNHVSFDVDIQVDEKMEDKLIVEVKSLENEDVKDDKEGTKVETESNIVENFSK